jgi:hypothetical protein
MLYAIDSEEASGALVPPWKTAHQAHRANNYLVVAVYFSPFELGHVDCRTEPGSQVLEVREVVSIAAGY